MSINRLDSAVIFAGGKSSRMGEDKSLLPFNGYSTLAEYQYNRLSKIFNRVYISAKSDKFNFQSNIIEDIYSISSPLVAIVSIFETLDIDEIFVLSVDAPFVDREVIKHIYNTALPSKDAVVALSPNGAEPLCAIYKKETLPSAKKLLEKDSHKLKILLNTINTQYVEFTSKDKFKNLNYPQEYREALLLD
jgi:molybdopterin-guanine dinucleotide biosynthesis protein A